jgi:outer membrane PBP1 activator LpoA protein
MHRKFPRQLFTALVLGWTGFMLAGCAATQSSLEVASSPPQEAQNTTQVETHALDQDQAIISAANPIQLDPWQLVEDSIGKSPAESNALLLTASELFLGQQHYSTAYTMLEEIDSSWLDSDQQLYFTLIRTRYALLTGNTSRAQSLLAQVPRNDTMSRENYARLLQLDIAIAAQQLDFRRAIISRISLDSLLGEPAQLVNQRRILNTLARESGLFPSTDNASRNYDLQGWMALAELKRQNQLNDIQITTWQQQYPQHPARINALAESLVVGTISSENIALLLPMTSKLGRAAEAFRAGFEAAVIKDGRFDRSRVYDIGNETDLVGFYFQSAINDGADFIIGPLGRAGAQSLMTHLGNTTNQSVSTLLLGELTSEQDAILNLWGLSLSPEQDAADIAERAISRGMRSAVILQKNNDWGTRLGDAFTTAFESKGGKVVGKQSFEPTQTDYSNEVKVLLDISRSERRHQQLQNLLGKKLKFSVRRRNDVDFIFLAGNTRDARRIVPLTKFYRAHDLPIYASSSAYNGKFNKFTDEDLKDLKFADLPWLLNKQVESQARESARIKAEQEAAEAEAQALAQGLPAPEVELPTDPVPVDAEPLIEEIEFEALPYNSATLNRLYALGHTAFETIPQLSYLQSDEWYHFDTHTMSLYMDENRNLRHTVAWGKYTADGITITITP